MPPYEEYSRQMWQRANGIRDCMIDLINAPEIEVIPISWIYGWIANEQVPATSRLLDYRVVEQMVDDWMLGDWKQEQNGEEE